MVKSYAAKIREEIKTAATMPRTAKLAFEVLWVSKYCSVGYTATEYAVVALAPTSVAKWPKFE